MNIKDCSSRKERPVRILQYGEGNFLRAFVDWLVDIMNEKTDFNSSVMMVQPLENGMSDMINAQDGYYTTILSAVDENGKEKEEMRKITSVLGCINPYKDYDEYISYAESADLRFIFSNTTEAGITYCESDNLEDRPQSSFPAKIAAFLYRRYTYFKGDESKGLVFIPCELIDKNGDMLKKYVIAHARRWNLPSSFISWVETACHFCNSLVDRIVPGYPRERAKELCTALGYEDNLLDAAERFLFWAIEYKEKSFDDEIPLSKTGEGVVWTPDMTFYRTRKVRILNGTHTMTVLTAMLYGLDTIKECMDSGVISSFMEKGLFSEIIKSMDGSRSELESYARDVLKRFQNPYVKHMLSSISLNSVSKFKTRDLPSLTIYMEKENKVPPVLSFSLASLIAFYNGKEIKDGAMISYREKGEYSHKDSPEVLTFFYTLNKASYKDRKEEARIKTEKVLSNVSFWGEDLTEREGLADTVSSYLELIYTQGMKEAIKRVIK